MKQLLTIIILSFFASNIYAQSFGVCKDSTYKQSNSACPATGYYPVCGCDNITYKNACYANSEGLLSYTQGICEEFALELFPNAVTDKNADMFIPIILSKNSRPCNFIIMDLFGNIKINTQITTYYMGNLSIPQYSETANLANLNHGMYLAILVGGNTTIVKRLVRAD